MENGTQKNGFASSTEQACISNECNNFEHLRESASTSSSDALAASVNKLEFKHSCIILSPKAMDRILHICNQPRLLVDIGPAFPLLVWMTGKCGRKESCIVSYHDAANELHVAHGTIKNWASSLAELGLISKDPRGVDGVEIRLASAALAGDQDGIAASIRSALIALQNQLEAAQLVSGTVVKDVMAGFRQMVEGLQ